MAFFGKLKKQEKPSESDHNVKKVSMTDLEHAYEEDQFVEAASMLHTLLEYYGERKKKNHKFHGREFIHFILSNKHKDLKNVGYTHWVNINKIILHKSKAVYPYHKENLRKAIDFFKKEIKSLNTMKTYVVE